MAAKMFRLATVFLSLGVSVNPLTVAQALPGDPSYFCYERSIYGNVTNLNEWCRQNPGLSTKTVEVSKTQTKVKAEPKQSEEATKKRVVVNNELKKTIDFSELNYEDGVLTGSAKNKTREAITDGGVGFIVQRSKDKVNWKMIDVGVACFLDGDLQPKKTTAFKAKTSDGDRLVITKVGSVERC